VQGSRDFWSFESTAFIVEIKSNGKKKNVSVFDVKPQNP
jgi:hypothetical protein